MAFVDGFLGLLSAAGTGTATELTGASYRRQPISFSRPVYGKSTSMTPFSFGSLGTGGTIAGRAVFDAPTSGRLLLVLPVSASRPLPQSGPTDQAEARHLHLQLDALAPYPNGDAFSGPLTAGATIGTCYDEADVVSRNCVVDPATGSYRLVANLSPLSVGVALSIVRGVLGPA